ncbi:hypothetical protein N7537_001510 [Penicillium hordei]|uniref:Zinc finger RING-type eukaryotic domain-containing protein n=1 Tax=Penicillium hordei TaxID=40994 RepID=A0AAD6H625_9EURO|nr:uncharacterized protein N7537_001510 [Penicillium hordei]KAJ5616396.1 hypothetical protein N7537_001510 [Penicillium hordei]
MPLFIPLFVQLTPQSQSFNFNNPVLVEVQVPSEARVPFHDYRQVSEDIGGLSTLPYPLPGSSIQNPIDVEALSDTEASASVYSHDLHRPGDSIVGGPENPIEIDAVSVGTSDATELIASLPASPARTDLAPDGRTLEAYYECKICYSKVVDLALGCGHTYCYDCFNYSSTTLSSRKREEAKNWRTSI